MVLAIREGALVPNKIRPDSLTDGAKVDDISIVLTEIDESIKWLIENIDDVNISVGKVVSTEELR